MRDSDSKRFTAHVLQFLARFQNQTAERIRRGPCPCTSVLTDSPSPSGCRPVTPTCLHLDRSHASTIRETLSSDLYSLHDVGWSVRSYSSHRTDGNSLHHSLVHSSDELTHPEFQSETPKTASHPGHVQTFGVFAAGAFSRRVAQSEISASQWGHVAMWYVTVEAPFRILGPAPAARRFHLHGLSSVLR